MFRPTNPQRSMFESEYVVPDAKAQRLRKSWAEVFRSRVLPAIDEEIFRDAFSSSNGRPNKPVRLLMGLHLLKDWHDLTDEQVIEQFEYNLQWHYALGVPPEEAHVCQKTLHNFRVLLMESGRAQAVFEDVTRALAEGDGVKLGRQRMDSTHVLSNIASLTRLGVFVETVANFLKELGREHPEEQKTLNAEFHRRYLDREGYFSDAKRSQAQRRLPVVARDVYALLLRFREVEAVRELASFGLLQRLFDEQCELRDEDDDRSSDGNDAPGEDQDSSSTAGSEMARVQLKAPAAIKTTTLQSPYDPDATYGRKGKGYEVQVAETCDEDNPYQLITTTAVNGAHESDQRATIPILEQLDDAGMKPEVMIADTGYGSGANIVAAAERDVELLAPVQDPDAPSRPEVFTQPAADVTPRVKPAAPQPGLDANFGSTLSCFVFDTTCHEIICCPGGQVPARQHVAGVRLEARFEPGACGDCAMAERCPTKVLKDGGRRFSRAPATIATEIRQVEQQQGHFKDRYRIRSGIESTNAELKGRHGLGALRVRGKTRVELAVTLKSLALNVKRAAAHHVQILVEVTQPAPCPA